MKKIIITSLLLSLPFFAFTQEDYLDTIVNETCKCVANISTEKNADQKTLEAGLCMISAAQPYSDELAKDHDINFNSIETEGEKLGRLIGLKMVNVCPETLLLMASLADEEEEDFEDVSLNGLPLGSIDVSGKVKNVSDNPFVIFTLKEKGGRTNKYYWFGFADSNADLISEYKSFNGQQVDIQYITQEMFDPKIGEYREFRVITSINK